jgi:putative hydrolase of HD superfamily
VSTPSHVDTLRLAYDALALKDQARTGWVQHGVSRPESVAAHAWGTAYLCLLFAEAAGVNRERAVIIAVLHDLAEATTGDFAARLEAADRQITEDEKSAIEQRAIVKLLPEGTGDLRGLWQAYELRTDAEARFVRDMNLIDMCLQAVKYESEGRYDPAVLIPSSGGHRHLDEFFLGARARLQGELAKQLFDAVHDWYLEARPRAG